MRLISVNVGLPRTMRWNGEVVETGIVKEPVNGLVMGPWFHGMWAGREGTGGTKFGDQDFGMPTATYFQDKIEFPFFDAYLRFKRAELKVVDGLSEAATCARYAEIY